jgi:hypothetical protein
MSSGTDGAVGPELNVLRTFCGLSAERSLHGRHRCHHCAPGPPTASADRGEPPAVGHSTGSRRDRRTSSMSSRVCTCRSTVSSMRCWSWSASTVARFCARTASAVRCSAARAAAPGRRRRLRRRRAGPSGVPRTHGAPGQRLSARCRPRWSAAGLRGLPARSRGSRPGTDPARRACRVAPGPSARRPAGAGRERGSPDDLR